MVFSTTSKNIYLRHDTFLFLCATCKVDGEDRWEYSEVNIERHVALNSDGTFDITRSSYPSAVWAYVMKPGTLQLKGTVMHGTLTDQFGGHEMSLCLDIFITNDNGTLQWKVPYVHTIPLRTIPLPILFL
jgi:hypothetical protein